MPGVRLVQPARHTDDRGFLSEVFNSRSVDELGIDVEFVQENHIASTRTNTIRGLHFQLPPSPTAKLVRVTRGAIQDVGVDLRADSPTFGDYVTTRLSEENWSQLYLPPGTAHGFCTLSDDTHVSYFSSAFWDPELDSALRWDDRDLGIQWELSGDPILSEKDLNAPTWADFRSPFRFENR